MVIINILALLQLHTKFSKCSTKALVSLEAISHEYLLSSTEARVRLFTQKAANTFHPHAVAHTGLLCSLSASMRLAAPLIVFHPLRGCPSFWPIRTVFLDLRFGDPGKTITM